MFRETISSPHLSEDSWSPVRIVASALLNVGASNYSGWCQRLVMDMGAKLLKKAIFCGHSCHYCYDCYDCYDCHVHWNCHCHYGWCCFVVGKWVFDLSKMSSSGINTAKGQFSSTGRCCSLLLVFVCLLLFVVLFFVLFFSLLKKKSVFVFERKHLFSPHLLKNHCSPSQIAPIDTLDVGMALFGVIQSCLLMGWIKRTSSGKQGYICGSGIGRCCSFLGLLFFWCCCLFLFFFLLGCCSCSFFCLVVVVLLFVGLFWLF